MTSKVVRPLTAGEREQLARFAAPRDSVDGKVLTWVGLALSFAWILLSTVAGLIGWFISQRAVLPCMATWVAGLAVMWGVYLLLRGRSRSSQKRAVEQLLNAATVELTRVECRGVVELRNTRGKVLQYVLDLGDGKMMLFNAGDGWKWPVEKFEYLEWVELRRGRTHVSFGGNDPLPVFTALGPVVPLVRVVTVDAEVEERFGLNGMFDDWMGSEGIFSDLFAGTVETVEEDLKRHIGNVRVKHGGQITTATWRGKRD